MLNQCTFIGRLGADPEAKTFQNGGKVCNLRLAVSERWKDRNGERQERTEWVPVAIFSEGLAGIAERYLRKGSMVYLSGQWRTRKWQDQSGNDRYTTELVLQGPRAVLVMLDSKSDGGGQGQTGHVHSGGWDSGRGDDLDDEIPF